MSFPLESLDDVSHASGSASALLVLGNDALNVFLSALSKTGVMLCGLHVLIGVRLIGHRFTVEERTRCGVRFTFSHRVSWASAWEVGWPGKLSRLAGV